MCVECYGSMGNPMCVGDYDNDGMDMGKAIGVLWWRY